MYLTRNVYITDTCTISTADRVFVRPNNVKDNCT